MSGFPLSTSLITTMDSLTWNLLIYELLKDRPLGPARQGPRGPAHLSNYPNVTTVTVEDGDHAALKTALSSSRIGRDRYEHVFTSPYK